MDIPCHHGVVGWGVEQCGVSPGFLEGWAEVDGWGGGRGE